MRVHLLPAAVALLAGAAPRVVVAQTQFQGSVSIRVMQDNGAPQVITYSVRNGVARYDVNGPGGEATSMIMDQGAGRMVILMPSQHVYMEQPMDLMPAAPKGAAPPSHASVKPTGRKETIAGYECEHVIVKDDSSKPVDVCVTHALGSFMAKPSRRGSMSGGGPSNDWSAQLGPGAFPLRVTEEGRTMFEVVSVKREHLDAALFAPPPGWQKIDMSGMGRMQRP